MTDPQPEPVDDDTAGFHIVPDAELYLRLERRVRELGELAELGPLRADLAAVQERLSRHRDELELIKSRMVQLVEYVQHVTPAAPAPTLNRSALL